MKPFFTYGEDPTLLAALIKATMNMGLIQKFAFDDQVAWLVEEGKAIPTSTWAVIQARKRGWEL